MTRQEAIDIIVKSLEDCNNKELGEVYMSAVDCSLCPIKEECKNSDLLCLHLIEDKLNEEDKENETSQ